MTGSRRSDGKRRKTTKYTRDWDESNMAFKDSGRSKCICKCFVIELGSLCSATAGQVYIVRQLDQRIPNAFPTMISGYLISCYGVYVLHRLFLIYLGCLTLMYKSNSKFENQMTSTSGFNPHNSLLEMTHNRMNNASSILQALRQHQMM